MPTNSAYSTVEILGTAPESAVGPRAEKTAVHRRVRPRGRIAIAHRASRSRRPNRLAAALKPSARWSWSPGRHAPERPRTRGAISHRFHELTQSHQRTLNEGWQGRREPVADVGGLNTRQTDDAVIDCALHQHVSHQRSRGD
jgi:hypothetical protein